MNEMVSPAAAVDEKYYQVATPRSFAERLVIRARDKIYDDFMRICAPRPDETILDIGVSDVVGDAANVLERRYPYPARITAAGLGEGAAFRASFQDVDYRQINANEALPFPDGSFDVVTSNAVLEHVGGVAQQRRFIAESLRVGGRLFLTVPHRYFPVEHHTGIPLLHWTDRSFALACRILGKTEWSQPQNLIMMTRRGLVDLCPPGVAITVGSTGIGLGPCSANLYLSIDGAAAAMPGSRR